MTGNRDRYGEPLPIDDEPMSAASRAGALLRKFDEGMSTRAIAPIVGVHHDTVAEDLKPTVGFPTVERPAKIISLDGRERPAMVETIRVDANTGEVPRSADEIRQHCAELRAVLAEARARRKVDQ